MTNVMAEQFEADPGNDLAFFSRFDGLQERHLFVPTWALSRGMTESDREAFIARLTEESQGIPTQVKS